jgi:cytochrome b pre-mRNA-processing protein 3
MKKDYIYIYNNLVKLTRNKKLYTNFVQEDTFSDRLLYFLLHFSFFLKNFKSNEDKKKIQDIYDYIFKQLELSIREIGYGDQSINKQMKNYLNLFHEIIIKVDNWENETIITKKSILSSYLNKNADTPYLIEYFEKYRLKLINNTLNSFIKGVVNH